MSDDPTPLSLRAGQIVLADWRGDALPKEPNKLRPAVVIDRDAFFGPHFPNTILVPLTDDARLAMPEVSLHILPTPGNGCTKPCWAASYLVTTTAKSRVRATQSSVTPAELLAIREQVALAIGI